MQMAHCIHLCRMAGNTVNRDPIWHVTSRSSEVGFPQEELYRPLPFYLYYPPVAQSVIGKYFGCLQTM